MVSNLPPSEATATVSVADLVRLAALTYADADLPTIWSELGRVLAQQFGYSLFTILTYSPNLDKVVRIHSTRHDLHPLGQRSSQGNSPRLSAVPPQRKAWVRRLFEDGRIWRGSTKEDLKAVFEDWELLWSVGLGSVLNIPVRLGGKTIGSLNILDNERAYDEADLNVGILIAQMVAFHVGKAGHNTGFQVDCRRNVKETN
nr:hypothetical protein LTR18_004331 [Exophiala xenobiotica]